MSLFQTNSNHHHSQRDIFQKRLYIRISTHILNILKYSINKKYLSFAFCLFDIFSCAFTEGKSTCISIKMQQGAQCNYIIRTNNINQNLLNGVRCGWCTSRMFRLDYEHYESYMQWSCSEYRGTALLPVPYM